jgi:uncharacterized protein (TIGR02001 family)
MAADLTLVSDYRFRGVSLSSDRPAAQADVAFEQGAGWYAGGFASSVHLYDPHSSEAQALAYAGYAQRLENGVSVDIGATYAGFSGEADYDYAELHAGFSTDSVDGRIYLSPNYFGQSVRTVYLELNGSRRISDNIRLVAHGGLLEIVTPSFPGSRSDFDARAGIELALGAVRLQLSRVGHQRSNSIYPVNANQSNGVWLASVSASF